MSLAVLTPGTAGTTDTPVRVIERDGYVLTNHRALCRRGVLWIGQTCNLRCHFCYFLDKIMDRNHPEHDFFELDKLKAMCKTLVDFYGNSSVDIQGGEPTIYRHITQLIQYCNEIGLKPTLITNGQVLANPEKCRQLKEAGVYDLLISVHGLGQRYDKIVVVNGAAVKLQKAIDNVAAAEIPFRFNCVLCTDALPDLLDVARLAVAKGARAVNYIAFNPFIDQACGGKRSAENVPRYSEVVNYLLPAIDLLDANGIEVNVRYLPFCLFPEKYRKFVQNFQQIVYDLHEWESAGEAWSSAEPQRQTVAPLSEPVDFFRHIEALRLNHFGRELAALPADQRWGSSVSSTVDALEARATRTGPVSVSLYGSSSVGNAIRQAVASRPSLADKVTFVAFISSPQFRTADTLDGLPWLTPDSLSVSPDAVVINTSESSRRVIADVLKDRGLEGYTIEVFGQLGKAPSTRDDEDHPILKFAGRAGYEYLPYLPELGPMPDSPVLEQAYKEFRVLMPKTMHPYAKGEECSQCSLRGICDGFHKDYAEIFGFGEASSQPGAAVTHPCHYIKDQLKVVEAQEYDWALPAGYQPAEPVASASADLYAASVQDEAVAQRADEADEDDMVQPKRVLYFAENALSSIQGGGIVAYAVLQGLSPDDLLGFFDYRNITPAPEYADRFTYLGTWRTPGLFDTINRLTEGRSVGFLHRVFTEQYIGKDFAFVQEKMAKENFVPEIVYFAGLSYRYLRLAVMAAEHYNLPMVLLNMDDWMTVERSVAGPKWGARWYARIVKELTKASARSLVSTSNSPRLAARLSDMTGYRHVAANNCCSDLMGHATETAVPARNEIPVIAYAGAMNPHLQGETLKILASSVTELNAEGTRVHLHIYTPWEFAPEANSIAVPNAVYYKGHVGREQLADIYRQADFLVTTVTHREGNIPLFRHSLSTKLSEYLCAGKPVISMGHPDWHLHEYVQDHGCGFSIPIDENYLRATIKAKLRRILATSPAMLGTIGRRNRELWERAHDTSVMARDTRRAIGMSPSLPLSAASNRVRGVVWVGGLEENPERRWIPLAKLKTICRRLRDVFEHDGVDVIGQNVRSYPALDALVTYCEEIGLTPTVVDDGAVEQARDRWEPAGTRWSLGISQRNVDPVVDEARNVFDQVAELRHETLSDSPVERAINQLTIRVPESAARKLFVWVYGSTALGSDVIAAIEAHSWLSNSVQIGGYLSSPGLCKADVLDGHAWTSVDMLTPETADLIVVTSETSRLAIQEELSRAGLLDRAVPLFGMAGTSRDRAYRRIPGGPGQMFVPGLTARDYATRELVARTLSPEGWTQSGEDVRTVQRADAA